MPPRLRRAIRSRFFQDYISHGFAGWKTMSKFLFGVFVLTVMTTHFLFLKWKLSSRIFSGKVSGSFSNHCRSNRGRCGSSTWWLHLEPCANSFAFIFFLCTHSWFCKVSFSAFWHPWSLKYNTLPWRDTCAFCLLLPKKFLADVEFWLSRLDFCFSSSSSSWEET